MTCTTSGQTYTNYFLRFLRAFLFDTTNQLFDDLFDRQAGGIDNNRVIGRLQRSDSPVFIALVSFENGLTNFIIGLHDPFGFSSACLRRALSLRSAVR